MAISVVHASNAIEGISVASVTSSPTFASTSGNLLVGGGACWGASAVGSTPWADGGTNTWAHTQGTAGNGPTLADLGYAKNITGKGSQSATFTVNSAQYPSVVLIEASGCDTTAPQDVAPSFVTTDNVSTLTRTITPPAGEHLLVAVGCTDFGSPNQTISNAGTGSATWTTIKNDSGSGEPIILAYAIVTANGTSTYGVTYTPGGAGDMSLGICAFKAASGGGGAQTVNPNAIGTGENVYQPTGKLQLLPNAISTAESLYQPTARLQVLPNAIVSAESVYQPTVSMAPLPGQVNPNAIPSAEFVQSPTVTQQVLPNTIATGATLYAPTVTLGSSTLTVNPGFIASAESVYPPALPPSTGTGALSITLPTSYVYVPISSMGSSQPATVAIWARMDAITNQGELLCILDATVNQVEGLWSKYTNLIDGTTMWEGASIIGGDANVVTPNAGLGNWHYIAFSINTSGLMTLYFDGVSQGTNTLVGTMVPAYVGIGIPVSGTSIVAAVCHARVWSAVLTQAEVAAEMSKGRAVRTANLIGDWALNSDLLDSSGNGLTLIHDAGGPVVFVPSDPLAQTVYPDPIASAAAVYSPTATMTVLPNGIGTGASVPQTITVNQQIVPDTITTAAQVYAPTLSLLQVLQPGTITTAESVYAPTLSLPGAQTVSPNGITTAQQVYAPVVNLAGGAQTVVPGAIGSAAQVYAPTLTQQLLPGTITTGAAVYPPTLLVAAPQTVHPATIGTAEAVYAPRVGAVAPALLPDSIPSQAAIYAPTVRVNPRSEGPPLGPGGKPPAPPLEPEASPRAPVLIIRPRSSAPALAPVR